MKTFEQMLIQLFNLFRTFDVSQFITGNRMKTIYDHNVGTTLTGRNSDLDKSTSFQSFMLKFNSSSNETFDSIFVQINTVMLRRYFPLIKMVTLLNSRFYDSNLLYLGFNQDHGCFACGTGCGYRIYHTDPLDEKERYDFSNGIGHVAMLYKYNYLGLVGGGLNPQFPTNEVVIWDDLERTVVIRISDMPSRVCGVRLRRDRIVVILEQMIKVYSFSVEFELLVEFETAFNSNGLCCLMGHADRALMAFPAKQPGVVRTVDLADPTISIEIAAHESPLACMAFNNDGTLLATASEKGTLIRIFDSQNGLKLHEFRRGTNPAVIYSISFNDDSTLLCVGSGHGTVHVFSLSGSSITYPKRAETNFLKKYMSAKHSFVRIQVPTVTKYNQVPFICAFGAEPQSLIEYLLCSAEPLKKKKRIDPAIIRGRLERKKKKIEKSIRLLLKQTKKLKPIEELTVENKVIDNIQNYIRPKSEVSYEELQNRSVFLKEWAKYQAKQYNAHHNQIRLMMESQQKALEELKLESETLYSSALEINPDLIPCVFDGPVSTPPIPGYETPDGDYKETTLLLENHFIERLNMK
ncbi:WD repeat domain phosphoinositide-interacting protein 3 [Trichinella papuae]|uniref:Large ribosomal subunit protein mL40 n=1 Tax=Trichinella papuae TaxID=268474 RepID=A0A0V1MRE1_9BILA|nr:WD repeat domain phosphoinositide-interacting protein 3 [Trichinella papuae]